MTHSGTESRLLLGPKVALSGTSGRKTLSLFPLLSRNDLDVAKFAIPDCVLHASG